MPHHAGAEGNWRGTFQALPSGQPAARQGEWVMADPVLQVRDLEVSFRVDTGTFFRRNYQRIRAVNGISFDVHRRSEEHTPELQSRGHIVCRLPLEKKKLNHMHSLQ